MLSTSVAPATNLYAAPLLGMSRAVRQAQGAAEKVAKDGPSVEAMIELREARLLLKANAAVARTADEVVGAILNQKG
jgi:hypothetical protein